MSVRASFLALVPVLLVLGGCGGSGGSGSSTATSSAAAPSSPTTTTATSTAGRASSSSSVSAATSSPSVGVHRSNTQTRPSGGAGISGGSTDARVPATFTLRPGPALSPSSVTAPAFLAVELTVSSSDTRPHVIALGTPTPHTFQVPPHGHAGLLVPGLRAGTYEVDVDGHPAAALIIGGEPGP